MRRTLATLLMKEGTHIKIVSERLIHAHINITLAAIQASPVYFDRDASRENA